MKAKIGDKIRAVLEKYPEVKRRRAQLNAIGYLFKRDSDMRVQWSLHEKSVSAVTSINAVVSMKSLSEYLYEPPSTLIVNGDTIKGPMLVFNDGKLEVAP